VQFISDADVEGLPPPPHLIEHVLPVGGLAALVGGPGDGKTFVALDMAFCIATGIPFLGHAVKQGTVAYVLAEGTGGVPQRVRAWKIAQGKEGDVGVAFLREPVQLLLAGEVQALLAALKQLPSLPILVVIDTLARCFVPGDENSAKDMGKFVAGLDCLRAETGAAVLVVHHSGRKKDHERGSTALRGAVDTLMVIRRHPKDSSRRLKCEKQKDGEPFAPIAFRLEEVEVDEGLTSCVVKLADSAEPPKLTKSSMKAINALSGFTDGVPFTFTEWLHASGLKHKGTFVRAVNALLKLELIEKKDGKYFMPGTKTDGHQ